MQFSVKNKFKRMMDERLEEKFLNEKMQMQNPTDNLRNINHISNEKSFCLSN